MFCRVITEGMFGFRPEGLSRFSVTPRLPAAWPGMSLKNLVAFGGKSVDIVVTRQGGDIQTSVFANGTLVKSATTKPGAQVLVKL